MPSGIRTADGDVLYDATILDDGSEDERHDEGESFDIIMSQESFWHRHQRAVNTHQRYGQVDMEAWANEESDKQFWRQVYGFES